MLMVVGPDPEVRWVLKVKKNWSLLLSTPPTPLYFVDKSADSRSALKEAHVHAYVRACMRVHVCVSVRA